MKEKKENVRSKSRISLKEEADLSLERDDAAAVEGKGKRKSRKRVSS